jgi:hypothetical protein
MTPSDNSFEILQALGGLQVSVANLDRRVGDLATDVKDLNNLKAVLGDHVKAHDDINDRMVCLEKFDTEFKLKSLDWDKDAEMVDFLVRRYDYAMGAAIILNAIALLVIGMIQSGFIKLW